jgi:hypothetical protein
MHSRIFKTRASSELPFYCSPPRLFVATWLMMLVSFEFHISYTSYPDLSLALALFAASLASFALGHATVSLAHLSIGLDPVGLGWYRISAPRLRRFQLFVAVPILAVAMLNLKLYGLPPGFRFLGYDTLDYGSYGILRQLYFPGLMALVVTAPLEPKLFRRSMLYLFGIGGILTYSSRGFLLIVLFQSLIVFSLRSSVSKKKLYVIALSTLAAAITMADIIGNGRINLGVQALLGYMQIRKQYYDWPTAYLWVISYTSSPISNLCWIVHSYRYDHPSLTFLSSLLPGFLAPDSLEGADLGSSNIVDGVHTYIAKYYLDLWGFGVFLINYVWGLISGYLSAGDRITRHYLTSAVLIASIGFIFFADYLTILSIVIELAVLGFAQRYFTIAERHGPVASGLSNGG